MLQHKVVIVEDLPQLGGEALAMKQIGDPQRAARHLVLVRRSDAPPRRADGVGALGFLPRAVECHVRGQNQRTGGAHSQPVEHRNALIDEHLGFFEQRLQ